jgi:predicted AlkP superfamily phosphohydrolase/phosphomutase
MNRVLVILLDGYEQSLGQRLMAAGEMPEMARLAASSARFLLDHGPAQRIGLSAEHFATGLAPEAARRWSNIHLNSQSYEVWEEGTQIRPYAADLECRTVAFDVPYFDLKAAPSLSGMVNWGAHDPGIAQTSQPATLIDELRAKFGEYPAKRWIYAMPWSSAEDSSQMGRGLVQALDKRAEAACWLLGERLPDWDLALVSAGEAHSAAEGLWHGVDPAHPLHHLPAAAAAGEALRVVYRAIDRMVGKLAAKFSDAQLVVVAMGGMGANQSDVPSMLLLPELMYRHAFGSPWFKQPSRWKSYDGTSPVPLSERERWEHGVEEGFSDTSARRIVRHLLPQPVKALIHKVLGREAAAAEENPSDSWRLSLDWMPAARYRRFWPTMPVFALPSFFDGRLRVNLAGRESSGKVEVENYRRVLAETESVIRACTDPATGNSVVDFIELPALQDPFAAPSSQADLIAVWKGSPTSFAHPSLGRIGPVPYRRTGGHTGRYGMALVRADSFGTGDRGIRSSFDVVPTIIELLGRPKPHGISGSSLLHDRNLAYS